MFGYLALDTSLQPAVHPNSNVVQLHHDHMRPD